MRIGSLCSGMGGLDLAAAEHFGGTLAWVADIEPAAVKVLAALHPDVPNLGDITTTDWTSVEPVDVLTAGYPCQGFSHAGKRKGTDDERYLWPYVRDAIGTLRPMVVLLENVDGHRSLGLDIVLGDLAEMGLSARWGVVRASDAGAPHGRARVFILAEPADAGRRPPTGHPLAGVDWGKYTPAIRRWERLTRPAPAPTIAGANGRPRLSPLFVEWMQGLDEGHVTGHGLSNAQALKMLGNGVVPQQALLALRLLDPSGGGA